MNDVAAFQTSKITGSAELAGITAGLIGALPSWFGIPQVNAEYVESANRLSGLVARTDTESIGVLLYQRHFAEAAEIHLMAVAPSWHRRGVGRALVDELVSELTLDGCRLLQVKTLGATHPDRGYARTRAFYRSVEFVPLEETNDLWPGTPCLIMVRRLARPT
ncbi:GNAT family N-acetyltransferase [Streptomyces sp. NPDC059802]|uniref:GNAT family N-acetyltransferase n=1 Tax=Streptomyces sp. NPDC059802 TaxID=3346952 RepID=UPI0036603AAE